jgi:UDP-N-acetylmuramoyl-L-alanyl-D-glutamate--2,6-diaminopimelate ligase
LNLQDLVRAQGGWLRGGASRVAAAVDLCSVEVDSRRVEPGALFVALPGTRDDGARFAADAVQRGAAAVLAPRPLQLEEPVPQWVHDSPARVAGLVAQALAGEPARRLFLAGVTGTNGKTSVAHLVAHLLEAGGRRAGVLGTAGHRLADGPREATHTTPDAPELARLMQAHRAAGGEALAMEVSSHALAQERHAGLAFDAAIFTNLTRDHLDYHGSLEAYGAAKARLFEALAPGGTAIVHADDPASDRMARAARARGARVLRYSTRTSADLMASRLRATREGTSFHLSGMGIPARDVRFHLRGRFNVENALAALACALVAGVGPDHALAGLTSCTPAPGRMEALRAGGASAAPEVVVDYAHTPDALERALAALRRELAPGARLWCVFGCGGDRDRGKRALMGAAATRHADRVLLTSDNPRSEDPADIADEVLAGLSPEALSRVTREPDRAAAIREAISAAAAGDTVLVAGKGHETVQVDAQGSHPFDDRVVARAALEERAQLEVMG